MIVSIEMLDTEYMVRVFEKSMRDANLRREIIIPSIISFRALRVDLGQG